MPTLPGCGLWTTQVQAWGPHQEVSSDLGHCSIRLALKAICLEDMLLGAWSEGTQP